MADDAAAAVKMLSDSDVTVRLNGVSMIEELGDKAAPHVSEIGKLLSDRQVGVRVAAVSALEAIGPSSASEINALEKLLDSAEEDDSARMLSVAGIYPRPPASRRKLNCAAAAALGAIGEKAAIVAPKVAGGMNSKDNEMRAACVVAMGNFGGAGEKFEDQLIALLDDKLPAVVAAVCTALGNIADSTGRSSSTVANKLGECTSSDHACIQASALEALGKIGEDASIFLEDIVKGMNSHVPNVRTNAIGALPACGEIGQMYAAEVSRKLSDVDYRVRAASAIALPKLGARGAVFVSEVVALLEDPETEVRLAAVRGLSSFDSAVLSEYIGTLESISYWDPSEQVQEAAKHAIRA